MSYSLTDALAFLKHEIQDLEKEKNEAKTEARKDYLESMIEWRLERGIKLYQYALPQERTQELLDFFLDRTQERPDLKKLRELLEMQQEKQKKNWVKRIFGWK